MRKYEKKKKRKTTEWKLWPQKLSSRNGSDSISQTFLDKLVLVQTELNIFGDILWKEDYFCHTAQCPCLPVVPITKTSSWQWRVEAFLRFYFCPQVREEKFLHGTLISGRNYEREKLTLRPSSQYFDWSTNNE